MPYLKHFGLRDYPFSLTPDTNCFLLPDENKDIVKALVFGLERNNGIFKVTGDIGTGKTLIGRKLINELEKNFKTAYIFAPAGGRDDIILDLCREFDIPSCASRSQTLNALYNYLIELYKNNTAAVAIIDEAQELGDKGLETLRLLSNLETERKKLLQIVLLGQQELDTMLQKDSLRQLRERIVFSFSTNKFSYQESQAYIYKRLDFFKNPSSMRLIFSKSATALIAKQSGGIPRVINILADKALLAAFADDSDEVLKSHVNKALACSSGLIRKKNSSLKQIILKSLAASLITFFILSALIFVADNVKKFKLANNQGTLKEKAVVENQFHNSKLLSFTSATTSMDFKTVEKEGVIEHDYSMNGFIKVPEKPKNGFAFKD